MPKRRIDEELVELSALRHAESGDETAIAVLRRALRDPVNVIVAKAADVIAHRKNAGLIPDLMFSYEQLFEDAVKRDPQCSAKTAIAKALNALGCTESATYLKGLRHVQMEPVWGGQEDSAGQLRGTCALALVNCVDIPAREILLALIDAITDKLSRVREDAVQALAAFGTPECALLLRLKARAGDKEPAIAGLALEALLRKECERAVDFVARFLENESEEVCEQAALALGASRLPAAIELLKKRWTNTRLGVSSFAMLNGLSVSRLDSAIDFLLEVVKTGRIKDALDALTALEIHRDSPEIGQRIEAAVCNRAEPELRSHFERHFGVQD